MRQAASQSGGASSKPSKSKAGVTMQPTSVQAPSGLCRLPGAGRDHGLRPDPCVTSPCRAVNRDVRLTGSPDSQFERVACRELPDLVGIDPVPVRPLAGREQVEDRAAGRTRAPDRRRAPCLRVPAALGVGVQTQRVDDGLGVAGHGSHVGSMFADTRATRRPYAHGVDRWQTIIEPFRIHSVEPIRITTVQERDAALREAGWNLFAIHADDVIIDLLTDSGTGAMSRDQWAGIQRGDESYAGSPSWYAFLEARSSRSSRSATSSRPTRAAPRRRSCSGRSAGPAKSIPNNTHFDTTRANVEYTGARGRRSRHRRGPTAPRPLHPFKGNMDVAALEAFLTDRGAPNVPAVFVTITNNRGGGQPVSLANLRAVRAVCDSYGVPLFLDACRFAENAWFIHEREAGQSGRPHPRHRSRDGVARRRHDHERQEGRPRPTSAAGSRSTTTPSPNGAATCSS